jgi:MoaA/NifB/PqqE/SkfB family radical SAM enzyme
MEIIKVDNTYSYNVENDVPRTCYLYVTSNCNSNCSYCVFRKGNKELNRVDLTAGFIFEEITKSKVLKNCKFVLQGGEFTEHPEFLKIASFFNRHKIKTTLLTNCIEPDKVLLLEPLVNAITISYDGTPHDLVRGAPNNTQTIKHFLSVRKNLVPVTLQMTLGPWNLKGVAIQNFLMMCSLYKTECRFNVAQSDGLLKNGSYMISDHELSVIKNHISHFGRAFKVNTEAGLEYIQEVINSKKSRRLPCRSLSMYTTITAEGNVLLCQGLEYASAVIGNIYVDRFDNIWNRSAHIRKSYRTCTACYLSCQLIGDMNYKKEQELVNEG